MRLLIADDHDLFRTGLRYIVHSFAPDSEVVEAGDWCAAINAVETQGPFDLILVDLCMPGHSWEQGLAALQEKAPGGNIVVISASAHRDNILLSLRLGARGFIPKTASAVTLENAVRLVMGGNTYIPPSVLFGDQSALSAVGDPNHQDAKKNITGRQTEVLHELARGYSNKVIARRLGISEGTVKLHVATLLKSLGAHNRTQVVVMAEARGLIKNQTINSN